MRRLDGFGSGSGFGEAGDDILGLTESGALHLDGGAGVDTLRMAGGRRGRDAPRARPLTE